MSRIPSVEDNEKMVAGKNSRCVCAWCGGDRPHTPDSPTGCIGCWCEHKEARRDHRVRLKVASIPKPYKDVDELLRVAGGNAFEHMIEEAQYSTSWMISNLENRGYELCSPEGQQDAVDAMLGTLLSLPYIERSAYVRQLAERMELSEQDMRAALNESYLRTKRRSPMTPRTPANPGFDLSEI